MKRHTPVMEKLLTPARPNYCGVITENRNGHPRKCYMARGHKGAHFDVLPFKENPEKFFGSAKAYAKKHD